MHVAIVGINISHLGEEEMRLKFRQEELPEPLNSAVKAAGLLFAVGISRFASTMDGLRSGFLKDAQLADIVDRDLKDGQHRNPTTRPEYFTDAFFHHPDELRQEVAEAGFVLTGMYGLEGRPGWLISDFDEWWAIPAYRERLLKIARVLETEPSMLGLSAHIMAVARKSS